MDFLPDDDESSADNSNASTANEQDFFCNQEIDENHNH